jgi:hypothetical protein
MVSVEQIMSEEDAAKLVVDLVTTHAPHGLKRDRNWNASSLTFEFARGWSLSCTLSVSFTSGERTTVRGRERRGPHQTVFVQRPRVEVCWSSTGRSVAAATAALALYRDVTELAALIEARLAEETIGFAVNDALEKENA